MMIPEEMRKRKAQVIRKRQESGFNLKRRERRVRREKQVEPGNHCPRKVLLLLCVLRVSRRKIRMINQRPNSNEENKQP